MTDGSTSGRRTQSALLHQLRGGHSADCLYPDTPAIHVGNVSEFNAQFFAPTFRTDHRQTWERDGDHYAGLAVFYSPDPALVLLPIERDSAWTELQAPPLGWTSLRVATIRGGGSHLSENVTEQDDLRQIVEDLNLPLIAWGLTPEFCTLAEAQGEAPSSALAATRRFESKVDAHALFAEICAEIPGARVIEQLAADSPDEAANELVKRSALGVTTVLKSEFGVGGFGVALISPSTVSTRRRALRKIAELVDFDAIFGSGRLVIQEYIAQSRDEDLTYDGRVLPNGEVVTAGVGQMHVDHMHYIGVTVAKEGAASAAGKTAVRLGEAVGRRLASSGYQGWFDVDFVTDDEGALRPAEINARLTGPAIAHVIRKRLLDHSGVLHAVRTLDILPLSTPLSGEVLFARMAMLARDLRASGVTFLPTITSASADPDPYAGFALAAPTIAALDIAERVARRVLDVKEGT